MSRQPKLYLKSYVYVITFFLALFLVAEFSCNNQSKEKPADEAAVHFPVFPQCNQTDPRPWPQKWMATTLMSPFDGSTMYVALIVYDNSLKAMRTTFADMEGGYADLITINDSIYRIENLNSCLQPVAAGIWNFPAPDWINSTDHNCAGIKPILGKYAQWWRYQAGSIGNWLWTRNDDGMPWRMMFVNDSNLYRLPLFANFSMVNFFAFDSIAQTNLGPLVNQCRNTGKKFTTTKLDIKSMMADSRENIAAAEKERRSAWIKERLPNIQSDSTISLPTWPQTFNATSMMTPVNRTTSYPTTIAYDWNIKKQLTSMLQPDGSSVDAYLLDTITYIVQKYADSVQCGGALPNLGPPLPRWAYLDKCQSKLVLTDGPLSAERKTVIFTCPIEEGRVFWIWYTAEGKPIVFFETSPPISEGTSLSLADYYDFNPNATINPAVFNGVPANCMTNQSMLKKMRFHGTLTIDYNCNQCHNPVINAPNAVNLKK
jgi:hypothetical protein